MAKTIFHNPFRPGAGHMPPYLAGREKETEEFLKILDQTVITENLILTGLRGVGKTVLLDKFKPLAVKANWRWAGTDLSESTSVKEETAALRLLTDLSVVTSGIVVESEKKAGVGFTHKVVTVENNLNYETLIQLYDSIPGLIADKLKGVLEFVWNCMQKEGVRGVVFAYDEAQTMSDHPKKEQYPLSLLLDVFQSIQKRSIPFLLILTGLPTLFPQLVEARTFSERMFRVMFLDRLEKKDSEDAIVKPIGDKHCSVVLSKESIELIIKVSGGYPYFIQFICKEVFDVFVQQLKSEEKLLVPINEITRKLDNDFFAGRWARATDRQRELLEVIAHLPNADDEFTVQEIAEESKKRLDNSFSSSHVNQMLNTLAKMGLVYKNRYGKYSFAVPLLGRFILRQTKHRQQQQLF